jgi:hypothetical protein
MSMRAAHKGSISLIGLNDIVGVPAFASDESFVFLA